VGIGVLGTGVADGTGTLVGVGNSGVALGGATGCTGMTRGGSPVPTLPAGGNEPGVGRTAGGIGALGTATGGGEVVAVFCCVFVFAGGVGFLPKMRANSPGFFGGSCF
jgi:hypothetical protein